MKRLILALVVASIPASAGADPANGSQSLTLGGYVPLVCRADYTAAISFRPDGIINLGSVREFCNSGTGYQVVVEYTPTGAPGALILNGDEIALDPNGSTVVAEVEGPAILTRNIAYRPGSQPITSIRFRLEADTV
ncbi:hypothetical protein [Brevundimonas sp.]|uniref:hypothetical protein n=1 Tax=Brevundimonas sp. TaxID=1871086 RepID=UPI003F6F74AF